MKMWHIYTVVHYSALRTNKTCNVQVILDEVNQTHRDKCTIFVSHWRIVAPCLQM